MSKKQNTHATHANNNYLEETRRFTHDLKAPLMVLKGSFLENPELLPSADLVRKSVERLFEMSRSYLETLQSDDDTTYALETLCMREVRKIIREKLANLPQIAIQKGIHCTPKFYNYTGLQNLLTKQCPTHFIQARHNELHRILDNVLMNSIEAMDISRPYNHLICSLYIENNRLVIQIQDSGIGCSPKKAAQVFETQSSNGCGNGIGLSSARKLLQNWGASINFESKEGKGSVVSLDLPIHAHPQNHEIN